MKRTFVVLAAALALCAAAAATGLPTPAAYPAIFRKVTAMIPMRDGVRLHTEIYIPRRAGGPWPILLTRTPYGLHDDAQGFTPLLNLYRAMMPDGYIFVFQDIRGRYRSQGKFIMNRPPRPCFRAHRCTAADMVPGQVDEATDTYDTIAWLLRHVDDNNGRVGMAGISYGGWLTTMAMLDPHPALKAVSEQASPEDQFLGDDFHHNGAFRLSYGFEYAAMMETGKTNFHFHFNRYDTYEWYLRLGPLANVNRKIFHGRLPTWNHFVNHPNYDAFWKKMAFAPYLTRVTVPMLNVAGWYDQEDFYGPQTIYKLLERHDRHGRNYFVAGPWNHGGWSHGTGNHLGPVRFGSDTSVYFRKNVQARWFRYWLHQKGRLNEPKALVFQTGSNVWQRYAAWPPRRARARRLYFRPGLRLGFQPAARRGSNAYISEPNNPVPYRPRPVRPTYPGPEWPVWLVQDQRFVNHRPDVLSYESATLHHTVAIAGDIVAHLFAATTGSDSDWIVKLIDVYPQNYRPQPKMSGYELIIADEVFRGRFRHSYSHPRPITPGKVTRYVIDLHTNDHAFLPGHRIMVQVQSTWFPLIDRNPQTYVPNIFLARRQDFRTAWQHIYYGPGEASYISLPVVPSSR